MMSIVGRTGDSVGVDKPEGEFLLFLFFFSRFSFGILATYGAVSSIYGSMRIDCE